MTTSKPVDPRAADALAVIARREREARAADRAEFNAILTFCADVLDFNAEALESSGFGPDTLIGSTAVNLRMQAEALRTREWGNAS